MNESLIIPGLQVRPGIPAGCTRTAALRRAAGHEPTSTTELVRTLSLAPVRWCIPRSVSGTTRSLPDVTAVANRGKGDRVCRRDARDAGMHSGAEHRHTVFRVDAEYRYFLDGELYSKSKAEIVAEN